MPGAYCLPRCPYCRAAPGPCCADKARATRVLRHADRAALWRHVADVLSEAKQIREGIAQADLGETVDRGSFAQYLEEDDA